MRKRWILSGAAASAVALLSIVACQSSTLAPAAVGPDAEGPDSSEGGYDGPHTTACSTGPARSSSPYREKPYDDSLPSCVPRCGAEQTYRDLGPEEYAIDALPSGECSVEGERCKMAAGSTQVCPDRPTRVCNLSAFECECAQGSWQCFVVSQGGGLCGPCAEDAGAADADAEVAATAAPTFTPPAGTYLDHVCVALASSTPGATIHFTTDGSIPTVASEVYTAPLPLRASAVVRAIAVAPGDAPSAVAKGPFDVEPIFPDAFAPVIFSPSAGFYDHALDVALLPDSGRESNAICFTTDGTAPACTPTPEVCNAAGNVVLAEPATGWCAPGSTLYTAPIHVEPPGDGGTVVLKAVSCEILHKGDVTTAQYTITQ